MKLAYPLKIDKETMAYASGVNLGISTKISIEISSMLRGMTLGKAIAKLERVLAMKDAVPYRRFNKDVGHKPGMGPGRYPIKACGEVLKLLLSAKANAIDKGLSEEALYIHHIAANRAAQQYRNGRQSRRKMKRSHLQIVLAEDEKLKKADKKQEKRKTGSEAEGKKTQEEKAVQKTEKKTLQKETVEKRPVEKKPLQPEEKKTEAKLAKKPEGTDRPESKDIKVSKEEKKAPKSPSQK